MLEVEESQARAGAPNAPARAARDRFFRAALLGSLLALVPYLWMLAGPGPTLLRDNGLLGSLFDVQGHALLDGHLDVQPEAASFEGFRVDGRTYTYFGLVPSLLRLPVLALTDELDGELTQLSMLLGFVVLMAAGAELHWRVREQVRPQQTHRRADSVAAFLLQVTLGAGAVPLYLASRPVVYHEAELWGAALSVAALAAIVGVVANPAPRRIVWAGVLAALAVNTRFSVGLGPVLALGVLGLGLAAQLWSPRLPVGAIRLVASFGPQAPDRGGGRALALLVAACVVPLAIHASVNIAKFDTPFGIPIDKQVASQIEPGRRAALAANDGTIFGLKFVPTTLLQALRPDAVGLSRAFPFIGLPSEPAEVIGDVRFDTIQPSLSAPTSMPALSVLALIGIIGVARRRRLRPLLGVLAATAGGFALTLTIAFITTRYLADLLPFLLLAALAGVQLLLGSARRQGIVLGGVAALTAIGVIVNGATGLAGQRLLYPEVTEAERAAFVRFQDDVDEFLGRTPSGISAGPDLLVPAPGSPGDLFVVDRCAGLYVEGLDDTWLPVERTPRTGVHRLGVRFPTSRASRFEALLTVGVGPRRFVIASRTSRDGVVLAVTVGRRTAARSLPLPVSTSAPVRVDVSINPLYGVWFTSVRVDSERVITDARAPYELGAPAVLGADPGGTPRFSGRVERVETPPTVCRAVASSALPPGSRTMLHAQG